MEQFRGVRESVGSKIRQEFLAWRGSMIAKRVEKMAQRYAAEKHPALNDRYHAAKTEGQIRKITHYARATFIEALGETVSGLSQRQIDALDAYYTKEAKVAGKKAGITSDKHDKDVAHFLDQEREAVAKVGKKHF